MEPSTIRPITPTACWSNNCKTYFNNSKSVLFRVLHAIWLCPSSLPYLCNTSRYWATKSIAWAKKWLILGWLIKREKCSLCSYWIIFSIESMEVPHKGLSANHSLIIVQTICQWWHVKKVAELQFLLELPLPTKVWFTYFCDNWGQKVVKQNRMRICWIFLFVWKCLLTAIWENKTAHRSSC